MTAKFFNTSGPVKPDTHYTLDPLSRLDGQEVHQLIAPGAQGAGWGTGVGVLSNGVSPSSVVTPAGQWRTMLDFLSQRFPFISRTVWQQRMQAGKVLGAQGTELTPETLFTPHQRLFYYRNVEFEPQIPFQETILWRNEHLLVVDKPHFLPVIPSGKYVQQTLLTRLKNTLGQNDISPVHRIDRDTAGLVLFSLQPQSRNHYHALFRQREVHKIYECIAPWNPDLCWPQVRHTRITDGVHFMQQTEVTGSPNALTHITPLETHGNRAHYQLKPVTGQRHQLRVHMAALGLPIVGDGIYPILTPEGHTDYNNPLQLLAKSVAFTDPLTGQALYFESQLKLKSLIGCFGED